MDLISVPLKRAVDVELAGPLRNALGADEEVGTALDALQAARHDAVWKGTLEDLYRYHDQLACLMAKVPPHEVQIPFKWKDAFDKGSLFGGRISLTVSSLAYERVCVLWNIAAASSASAAGQGDSDEGRRQGAKLLQAAAGLWAHLKTEAPLAIHAEVTPDLRADTLQALSALMLAQAQETIALKCINDAMKDSMVAKVCAQCEHLYSEAHAHMQRDALRPMWDRQWAVVVQAKQQGMRGLSQLHQAIVAGAAGAKGEEISRLSVAAECLRAAARALPTTEALSAAAAKAERRLTDARKDNDFIYHERVPEASELAAITRAPIATATAVPTRFTSLPDPFAKLTPMSLRAALAAAEARRSERVTSEITVLRDGTTLVNAALASLGLPAALDASAQLPAALQARAQDIQDKGGLPALERRLRELPELLQRNKEILEEASRMLREEAEADQALRQQFGARWTRTESSKLTESFRANAAKYSQIIDNAIRADDIVQQKLNEHRASIELLQSGGAALTAAVPAAGCGGAGGADVSALRAIVRDVDALKAERDALESALQGTSVHAIRDSLPPDAGDDAVNKALDDALEPLRARVDASISHQDRIMSALVAAGGSMRAGGGAADARGAALARLTAAADAYRDLGANLNEGVKFYNDLTQLLVAFQNKVSDYCFARRTEKEELLKDLTQEASRNTANEPTVQRKEAPPRPAPPTPAGPAAPPAASLPYPSQPQGMPLPYGAAAAPMYYAPPPMPAMYNPYATLPYPRSAPQGYPVYPPPASQPHNPYYPYPPPQQ